MLDWLKMAMKICLLLAAAFVVFAIAVLFYIVQTAEPRDFGLVRLLDWTKVIWGSGVAAVVVMVAVRRLPRNEDL